MKIKIVWDEDGELEIPKGDKFHTHLPNRGDVIVIGEDKLWVTRRVFDYNHPEISIFCERKS